MNKVLLTLGCSFLERCWDDERAPEGHIQREYTLHEIPDRRVLFDNRLSTLLAKDLHREDINLARSGQGNTKSLDMGMDYIKDHRFTDIKVLVGFTEFGRFNFDNLLTGHKHKISPNWNTLSPHHPEYPIDSMVEDFYKYYYDEDTQVNTFINRVLSFDSFCKLRNIPVVYFFAYEYFNVCENLTQLKDTLYTRLVLEQNINLFNFNIKEETIMSWPEYINSYDDTYRRGHPIIDDNKRLLNLLRPYFTENLI